MNSRMRFALLAIAFFTILEGISGAAGVAQNFYCSTSTAAGGIVPDIQTCITATVPYVLIALLFSFALVAFAYLIGEVLNIQSFKGWYRAELWESIKSVLIVGVIFSVIVIFGEVATLVPGSPPNASTTAAIDNLYVNAYSYLAGCSSCSPQTLGAINYTNESFNNMLGISIGEEYVKSTQLSTYFTIPIPPVPIPEPPVVLVFDLGVTFNAYASSIIDTGITSSSTVLLDTMSLLIFPMLVVLIAQSSRFVFLIQLGLGILLPLGLIFRATPFLRSIGGTLIAIAIAAIIIYPALLALFNAPISYFFSPLYPQNGATGLGLNCPNFASLCSVLNTFNPIVTGVFAQLPSGNENDYAAFQGGNLGGQLAFFTGDSFFILDPLFTYLVPVVIAFILFVLDLLIGIILATNIAKALGGNIRLGIGKLRLV